MYIKSYVLQNKRRLWFQDVMKARVTLVQLKIIGSTRVPPCSQNNTHKTLVLITLKWKSPHPDNVINTYSVYLLTSYTCFMFWFHFGCLLVATDVCAASGLAARGRLRMAKGEFIEASENLFIDDLPANIDEAMLLTVFGTYGHISSYTILPLGSRNNGCALVSFANVSEATRVVDNLNGNIPQGLHSPIMVRYMSASKGTGNDECKGGAYAKSSDFDGNGTDYKDGGGGSFSDGGCGGGGGTGASEQAGFGAVASSENLFIGDLPLDFTDQQFLTVFSTYGTIKSHKILARGTRGKLAAVVAFSTADEAKWLVENLHGQIPRGFTAPIQVRYKRPTPDKGKAGWDGGKGGGVLGGWAGSKDDGDTSDIRPIEGSYWQPACSKGFYVGGGKGGGWTNGKAAGHRYGPYDGGGGGDGIHCGKGKQAQEGVTDITIAGFIQGLYESGVMPGSTPSIGEPRHSDAITLCVSDLPYDCTDVDLYKIFSPFGAIAPNGVHTKPGEQGALCNGYGFVIFLEAFSAQEAITILDGTLMPDGKVLRVSVQPGKGDSDKGKGA